MKQNEYVGIISVPNGAQNPLYRVMKKAVKAANIRKILIGTKEEVLARAYRMNAKKGSLQYQQTARPTLPII